MGGGRVRGSGVAVSRSAGDSEPVPIHRVKTTLHYDPLYKLPLYNDSDRVIRTPSFRNQGT